MNPLINFAINMINRSPGVRNNPMAQNYLQILQSGDSEKGMQVAENICRSYGLTKEQALTQAKKFFHI